MNEIVPFTHEVFVVRIHEVRGSYILVSLLIRTDKHWNVYADLLVPIGGQIVVSDNMGTNMGLTKQYSRTPETDAFVTQMLKGF